MLLLRRHLMVLGFVYLFIQELKIMAKGKKRSEIPSRPVIETEGVAQTGILAFCRQFNKYDAAQLLEIWSSTDSDGYGLARALEAYGFHPSEEMVTELSQLESHIHDALVTAEKAWVRENNIQLRIQPGQQVTFQAMRNAASGVIVGTDSARAIYYVKRDDDTNPDRSYCIHMEQVKILIDSCSDGIHKSWPCPSCGLGPCLHEIGG